MNENDFTDAERRRRNVLDWRGWKGDVWEAGIRTPLFIHAPQRFSAQIINQPADVHDLFPTFAAWAGVKDYVHPERPLDGKDLTPLLQGEAWSGKNIYSWVHPAFPPYEGNRAPREQLNEYRPKQVEDKSAMRAADQVMAMRSGDWKITRNADRLRGQQYYEGPQVVHRVTTDERETLDLSAHEPQRTEALAAELDAWWSDILATPRSFMAPTHYITDQRTTIRASTCAWHHEDLRGEVVGVRGMAQPGHALRWSLWVEQTGMYSLEVDWHRGAPPEGTRFNLQASGAMVEGVVDAQGAIQWSDTFMADAGPLTLELTLADTLAKPVKLFFIHVSREHN